MPAQGTQFQTVRGPANQPGQAANPAVSYTLLEEYRERFNEDGQQEIQQAALVPWLNVAAFQQSVLADVVLGQASARYGPITLTPYEGPAGGYPNFTLAAKQIQIDRSPLFRFNPEPHPRATWLFAAETELANGIGWPGVDPNTANAIAFFQQGSPAKPTGMAKVIVTYRPRPWAFGDDASANANNELLRNVKRNYKPAGQNITMPSQGVTPYRWVDYQPAPYDPSLPPNSLPRPTENQITVPLPQCHFSYTWMQVPRIPRQVFEFMGLINQTIFDGGRPFSPLYMGARQFRPGTVLYLYPEFSEAYFTITGTPVCDVTLHFCYQDNWLRGPFLQFMTPPQNPPIPSGTRYGVGWNFFFRPATRTFTRLIYEQPVNNNIPFPNNDDPFPFISQFAPTTQYTGSPYNYADLNQLFMIDSDTSLGIAFSG